MSFTSRSAPLTKFFTASFAVAHVFGWIARIMEQRQDNQIIRFDAHYVVPHRANGHCE